MAAVQPMDQVHPQWTIAQQTHGHVTHDPKWTYLTHASRRSGLSLCRNPLKDHVKDIVLQSATHLDHFLNHDWSDRIPERTTVPADFDPRTDKTTKLHEVCAPLCLCRFMAITATRCLKHLVLENGQPKPEAADHVAIVAVPAYPWRDANGNVHLRPCPYAHKVRLHATGHWESCAMRLGYKNEDFFLGELPGIEWLTGGQPMNNHGFQISNRIRGVMQGLCLKCAGHVNSENSEGLFVWSIGDVIPFAYGYSVEEFPKVHVPTDLYVYEDDECVTLGLLPQNELQAIPL